MQENATTITDRVLTNDQKAVIRRRPRLWLVLEFCVLCLLIPTVIITFRLAPVMFFFLWGAALFCWFVIHYNDKEFWKNSWKFEAVNKENLKVIIPRWIAATLGMLVFLYFYNPDNIFILFREKPQFIPVFMFAYPILSAFPQELIFCGYFFERFKPLFKTQRGRIIASAIVFAYAHVLYINWVAPLLSLIAGFIFATTYNKTRSISLVTLEHALYGISLFLVGLGAYFYGGNVH